MAQPAATQGDRIVGIDLHLIQPPGPVSPVTVPHPFSGVIDTGVSTDVLINGRGAALQDSGATNTPAHVPIGGTFVSPPSNRASILMGSSTVLVNGKQAARAGDPANTCNDPVDQPLGRVVAVRQVLVGG
jgi:uncharacterized Zn-binding protein involved in type VI secretion